MRIISFSISRPYRLPANISPPLLEHFRKHFNVKTRFNAPLPPAELATVFTESIFHRGEFIYAANQALKNRTIRKITITGEKDDMCLVNVKHVLRKALEVYPEREEMRDVNRSPQIFHFRDERSSLSVFIHPQSFLVPQSPH